MKYLTKAEVVKQGYWPQYFLDNLQDKIPDVKVSGDTLLHWKCPICGCVYEQKIKVHLRGSACNCSRIRHAALTRRNRQSFSQDLKDKLLQVEGGNDVLEGKKSLWTKLQFNCPKHGLYWQTALRFLEGMEGCPLCKKAKRAEASRRSKRDSNPYPQWFIDELAPDYREGVLNGTYGVNDKVKFICPKHGEYEQVIYAHIHMETGTRGAGCPSCAAEISKYGSSLELKLKQDLESRGLRVQKVRGLIKSPYNDFPLELDLYLPDYKVAVEVDGLWYHSLEHFQKSRFSYGGNLVNYHLMKTEQCEKKGIQLIHLFEDDLRDKYEVCLNLLLAKCGVLHKHSLYARKCSFVDVSSKQRIEFYNKYHVQGDGQGVCKALQYQGHLVALMSVRRGPSNTSSKGAWEVNRYAAINNYKIVGGFDKLLSYFQKKYDIHHWISYADRTVSNGKLYRENGWDLTKTSEPDYKYVYKGRRWHKFNFRIKRFKEDPNLKYQEGLTEFQLAQLNGIERIYDCGKYKFEKFV